MSWNSETKSFTLPDQLTIATMPKFLAQTKADSLPVESVNCQAIVQADSSVLALFLQWSLQRQAPIQVHAMPESLVRLVELYEIESHLQIIDGARE